METIHFSIDIQAPVAKVWDTMLNEKTYSEWTGVSWPNSYYIGKWGEGEDIRFVGDDQSGTLATITAFEKHRTVDTTHVAILLPGGVEDRTSAAALGWIGSKERYDFSGKNGSTHLHVSLEVHPDWAAMFNEGWPAALKKLKEICER